MVFLAYYPFKFMEKEKRKDQVLALLFIQIYKKINIKTSVVDPKVIKKYKNQEAK